MSSIVPSMLSEFPVHPPSTPSDAIPANSLLMFFYFITFAPGVRTLHEIFKMMFVLFGSLEITVIVFD